MIYAGFSRIGLGEACYNGFSTHAGPLRFGSIYIVPEKKYDSKRLERGLRIVYACFSALGL